MSPRNAREALARRPRPRANLARRSPRSACPSASTGCASAQLWHWIYFRGARDFDAMTNVWQGAARDARRAFTLERPEVVTEQVSNDGTRKWLHPPARRPPGEQAAPRSRCVYIPESDRGTLCVSSPGRLHADLHVLPHRHAAAGAQPDRGRDRRRSSWSRATGSATGRARRAPKARLRAGRRRRGSSPTSCSWAWASRSTISTA